jgi:hypothetical protein
MDMRKLLDRTLLGGTIGLKPFKLSFFKIFVVMITEKQCRDEIRNDEALHWANFLIEHDLIDAFTRNRLSLSELSSGTRYYFLFPQ